MKCWVRLIACIGIGLWALLWTSHRAQAATYFFTAEYLGGGSCGANQYSLPTNYSWNFPGSDTVLNISGTFAINADPKTSFASYASNMGRQTGSLNWIEVLPSNATINGLDTYSYTEIDDMSAGGMALGGQIIKVECKAGVLVSASIENFLPEGPAQPAPTFAPQ